METTKENGGALAVDLNENEEGAADAGEGPAARGRYVALKDRSAAPRAGVSGGQEAGRGHVYVTGNERNANRDASAQPPLREREITLDVVAAENCPPVQLTGGRVTSGVRGVLNGFNESSGQEEPGVVVGGGGLSGTTGASRPAVLEVRVSGDRGGGTRQPPAGESEGETPDSDDDDATPGEEATGCTRTFLPPDRQPCTGKHQRDGACTALGGPDVNMANGDVGSPEADLACCKQTGALVLDQTLGQCAGVKAVNGGFHIVTNARATCDWSDSDSSPENHSDVDLDLGETRQSSRYPGDNATGVPHSLDPPKDSPTLGPSAKPPPSCRSTAEDEFGDLSLPVRPQSLRTNSNTVLSLSCDATPLSPDDDGGFYFGDEGCEGDFRGVLEAGRRQSAPDKLPDVTQEADGSDLKLMPKRFGIADFFTRSLFSRKSKEPKALSHNATGWRLFGKTPVPDDPTTDPDSPSSTQEEELEEDAGESAGAPLPSAAARRKNLEFEPLSTTALILEDRPANLPAKSVEETQRHKMEYDEMVAGAKRREMKEAQRKKRQMKERHRQEDSISNAMVIWNNEILPQWDSVKGTRRVRDLWWQGLPPSVRGRVWSLAIGNELNITPELYEIFLSRAKEKWRSYSETSSVNDSENDGGASLADRESSLDLIKLDISRTFPYLFIFQKGGPYHDLLHSVLGAYTCYRPDIGYVQGMSFIAAVLILNLEEAEAFITFANLLNKPCQMAFFRVDHELMLKYFAAFEVFFEENLPRLFSHFQINNLTPDLYLIDWIFTLYSKSLPLDVACRVWDVFCRDGEESLFRTGLGILRLFEEVLLQMDFIHIAQFLTRLPEDLQAHTLFTAMANTHMISRNRRWAQVFSALTKDVNKETDKNSSPAFRS
ncbi:TBC1 domain family member 12 [Gasterosteus aculeatus]